jgi:capsule polysaccharide export protein KpsE/RkpR
MSKINIRVKLKPSSAITGATNITGANNVGGGLGLYKNISSNNLQFKTLVAGDNISLSATTDSVFINATQAQTSGVTRSEFDSYTGATDTTLSGLRSDVDTVSGQTAINTADIATLSGNTGVSNTKFNNYTGATDTVLTELRTDVDAVSGQTDTNTSDISGLRTDVDTVSGQTDTNTSDISGLRTDVDTVSGQTDTNTNNIATNTTNIGVVSGQTNTNTNDISTLQNNKLDDVVAGTNITIDKTDPLNPIISASGGGGTTDGVVSGATLSGDTLSLQRTEGLTDVTVDVSALDQSSQVTDLRNDVDTVSGDTATNATNIATVSGQTDTNTNDISTNSTDIDTISGQTDTNTNDISGLRTDVNTVSGNTDTNTSDISTLNSDFDIHTGNTNIHYPQSAITITESQISDFGDYVENSTFTGYTASTETTLSGLRSDVDTVSGDTSTNTNDISTLQSDVFTLSGDTANKVDLDATIVSQSSSVTLAQSNNNDIIECTGSITITIPISLTTGWQVFITNVGTGTITIASNGTLQSKGGLVTIADQYAGATVYHRGSDEHLLQGDLT